MLLISRIKWLPFKKKEVISSHVFSCLQLSHKRYGSLLLHQSDFVFFFFDGVFADYV